MKWYNDLSIPLQFMVTLIMYFLAVAVPVILAILVDSIM